MEESETENLFRKHVSPSLMVLLQFISWAIRKKATSHQQRFQPPAKTFDFVHRWDVSVWWCEYFYIFFFLLLILRFFSACPMTQKFRHDMKLFHFLLAKTHFFIDDTSRNFQKIKKKKKKKRWKKNFAETSKHVWDDASQIFRYIKLIAFINRGEQQKNLRAMESRTVHEKLLAFY